MRRTIIVIPDLVFEGSPLRQKLPALESAAEFGRLAKLSPLPKIETPEALWLGMSPCEGQLRQGPLTVSALGADPPDRSTHFHLSLMSLQEGKIAEPKLTIPPEDLRSILDEVRRLNTRSLTIIEGEGADHGLVWEGVGDLQTYSATSAAEHQLKSVLPEGDPERELRRLIDDSVNLLSELELNQRRRDQDLPPLNLLWPWGEGQRMPVPSLLLKRGERAVIESSSIRMEGLVRLAGYAHGERSGFGKGLNTRLQKIGRRSLERDLSIIVLDAISDLRQKNLDEEMHWFSREMDEKLLGPLLEDHLRGAARIAIVAPSVSSQGLALVVDDRLPNNDLPFDERSLDEKRLETLDAWTVIDQSLRPPTS